MIIPPIPQLGALLSNSPPWYKGSLCGADLLVKTSHLAHYYINFNE